MTVNYVLEILTCSCLNTRVSASSLNSAADSWLVGFQTLASKPGKFVDLDFASNAKDSSKS